MTTLAPDIVTAQNSEEFHINSDQRANWLLRKLAKLKAEKGVSGKAEPILEPLHTYARPTRPKSTHIMHRPGKRSIGF